MKNLIDALKPYSTQAYSNRNYPELNQEHFREWIENKVGYEHSLHMTSDEWTQLDQEYRKEYNLEWPKYI